MDRSTTGHNPTDVRVEEDAPQVVLLDPMEEAVRLGVASAPRLTAEQVSRITRLLGAGVPRVREQGPWVDAVAA